MTPVVDYEDRVRISTPEGVELELTLAGIGSRSIAGMIDLTIQAVIGLAGIVLFLIVLGDSGFGVAAISIWAFLVIAAYDIAFEVLAAGRTPGKRMTSLRVVRTSGRPVGFLTSATRNIVRILDFMPGMYGIGMLTVFLTDRNQRLGDLAAGTYVIRERRGGREPSAAAPPPGFAPPVASAAPSWDVTTITPEEIALVRSFLTRRFDLDPKARIELAAQLESRLRPRVAGASSTLGAEAFLEGLADAKTGRG